MWQFAEAVRGLADGCRELGLPVTGGNVSLYNQTGDVADQPDAGHRRARRARGRPPPGPRAAGGPTARRSCCSARRGRSSAARPGRRVVHGHLGGRPPAVDLAAERRAGGAAREPRRDGLVSSAHDLADGGLAQTLAESALRYGVGARLHLDGDPFTALFSESAARAVVTTADPAAVRAAAERGRRAGHRAGDDGRRQPGRRRPARAGARRAAGRLVGHAAGAVRRRPRPRSAPFRRAPSRPADAGAPSRPRSCAPSSSRCGRGWPGRPSSRRAPSSAPR